MKSKVLIVDDSSTQRLAWVVEFTKCANVVPVTARNGREALEAVKANAPDVVVTDLDMPEMNGQEFVEALKRLYPQIYVMIVSGRIEPGVREAMSRYPNVYLFSKFERVTAMQAAFQRIGIGCTHQATCTAEKCLGARGVTIAAAAGS